MSSPLTSQPFLLPSWSASTPSTWSLPSAPTFPAGRHVSSHLATSSGSDQRSAAASTEPTSPDQPDRYLPLQTFSSPNSTPLPAHTQALLDAKRQLLFTAPLSSRNAPVRLHPSSAHMTSRSRYAVDDGPASAGPSHLAGNRSRPHHRSSELAALAATERSHELDQDSPTRQVWRAKFRERCRQQMARDRARTLARTRGASFLQYESVQADDEAELVLTPGSASASARPKRSEMIGSDDLPSSDFDTDMDLGEDSGAGSRWWEEDEELIRRVMVAEYRRIKRAQEASGEREVGWLDPDEVAYLEEEIKREEADMRSASTYAGPQRTAVAALPPYRAHVTPTKNTGPAWEPGRVVSRARRNEGAEDQMTPQPTAANEEQPPEDLVDEDEQLYSHYLHHCAQAAAASGEGEGMDEDGDVSSGGGGGGDEAAIDEMSQSWGCDEDFEMALAAMPLPAE
ncbi:hypothetical protein ACQY0O_006823 [Thecaphora frezii]